ncbi:PHB depolymerase family esterase, partial [Klebsiella pneumoniae]|uniref:PHB depolymerase family esterase n=1 Tax=Klebsiella pneumoniae TaxID=573 RepID=UPI0034DDEAA7
MADILADLYPDLFSAAGIHSGLARGSAYSLMTAMSVMRSGTVSRLEVGVGDIDVIGHGVLQLRCAASSGSGRQST